MSLLQVDVGIRHPYPAIGGDTYYWWTEVYYLDGDDFSGYPAMRLAIRRAFGRSHTAYCSLQLLHFKDPPGRGNVIETVEGNFAEGFIPPSDDYAILINVAMVDFFDGDGNRFRKYIRQPFQPGDEADGLLTSTGIGRLENYASWVVDQGVFRTLHGGLLERYDISPRVHMRQLRHGTKRRERHLLAQEPF